MSRRTLGFVIFAIAVAAICVRLGFWQLSRREERRERNAMLSARLGADVAPAFTVMRDSTTAQFHRATAQGVYDFANELAVASRTNQGAPGVHIITPLRIAGRDTALLINRGWVYAPDAMSVDFKRWIESDTTTATGYLIALTREGRGSVSTPTSPRTVRRLDPDSLAKRFPYAIAPFMLVQSAPPRASADSATVRVPAPLLDEGPHLGYAVQWFAFAVIGLVGAGATVRADRRAGGRRQLATTAPRPRRP